MAKPAKRSAKKSAKRPATTSTEANGISALERQMETLGRIAGRAANVVDRVRARGTATIAGLVPAKKSAAKKSAATRKTKASAKRSPSNRGRRGPSK